MSKFRSILFICCIFSLTHLPAQEILRVGIGYFKNVEGKSFYAPIIVQNTDFEQVKMWEGEPLISIDGKDLRVMEDMGFTPAIYAKKTAEWMTNLKFCHECEFTSLNPYTGESRDWVGYNGIFGFGTDFFKNQTLPLKGEVGYLGFTYQIRAKKEAKLLFSLVVDEVKEGSPAEKAGIKKGDEISRILLGKGISESLYNVPLEWVITKMQGKIGTPVSFYINEKTKKDLKRANFYGEAPDDAQIIANCISGDCMDGYGILDDGTSHFEGEFKKGQYSGVGKLYKNGKLSYDGHFKDGMKNGSGTEFLANGTRVESIYTMNRAGNNLKYIRPDGLEYYELWSGEIKQYFDSKMNPIALEELPKMAARYSTDKNLVSKQPTKSSPKSSPPPPVKPSPTPTHVPMYYTTTTTTITHKSLSDTPKSIHTHTSAPKPVTPKPDDETCQRCNGTGSYAEYEKCKALGCYAGHVECAFCKGSGEKWSDKTHKKERCTHCKYINDQVRYGVNCATCKGSGLVRSLPKSCIFCQGSGKRLK